MSNPQQPEQRRSGETATTKNDPGKEKSMPTTGRGKGGKGGGKGSGKGDPRPHGQRPPHPD